jgi:hypothetical protein
MLAQDPFTGNLHEVPYPQVPGFGQVLYDGLGNPVGGLFDNLLSPLKSIVGNLPIVGGLVNSLLPGSAPPPPPPVIAPAVPAYAQPAPYPSPYMQPPMGNMLSNLMPGLPFRRCGPPMGWTTSALPYTTAPRRLYLRCSVWPGQAGLTPVNPGQWPTQAAAQAGATGAMMAMRRRRSSRRRR